MREDVRNWIAQKHENEIENHKRALIIEKLEKELDGLRILASITEGERKREIEKAIKEFEKNIAAYRILNSGLAFRNAPKGLLWTWLGVSEGIGCLLLVIILVGMFVAFLAVLCWVFDFCVW